MAYATGPFVLLTISGIPLGIALRFGVRRLSSVPDPLRARRRRGTVVPLALAVVVALVGAAALVEDGVEAIALWWPWAVALPLVVATLVWGALGLPRWWRLLAPLGLLILFVLPANLAWSWRVPGEGGRPLSGKARGRAVVAMVRTGEESDSGVVVALLRVALESAGENVSLVLRVIPTVSLLPSGEVEADSAEMTDFDPPGADVTAPDQPSQAPEPLSIGAPGIFGSLSAPADARLTVALTLEGYIPPLWWFPRDVRVVDLEVRHEGATLVLRRPPSPMERFSAVSQTALDGVAGAPAGAILLREEAILTWPEESGRFLQPGVYVLEYRRE